VSAVRETHTVEEAENSREQDRCDDDDSDELLPAHIVHDDSDVEKTVNYRLPVNPDAVLRNLDTYPTLAYRAGPPNGPFNSRWWLSHTSTVNWERRNPFIPCSHAGSCADAKCRCFRQGITCEKTCRCSAKCNRRFPGCNCPSTSTAGRRTCGTEKCLCVKFKRECDADLCSTCGATDLLDPVHRYDEEMLKDRCTNVGIQRAVPKKTLLGESEVHGFGLYAGQYIEKDDIIGEYTGEVLSTEESNRRAEIYEYERNMYLFKLNRKQEVDATYMGNKLRFINNANQNLTNCYPKVLLCNTVFRVALYASTDITAGTEFFFHYNYAEELTKHFKQPKGKVFAVKQTVKPTPKYKSKSKGSSSEAISTDTGPNRQCASLAKARVAKAAQQTAALLNDSNSQAVPTARHSGLQQARKTVSSNLQYRSSKASGVQRDRSKTARNPSHRENSNPSGTAMEIDDPRAAETIIQTQESVSDLVVQDTDDEDDDFMPEEDTQEAAEPDIPLSDVEEELIDIEASTLSNEILEGKRARGRPPHKLSKSANVVAVKTKLSGKRLGAVRKRKRPIVLKSDEEE
jgi:hypothetical protein